MMTDEERAHMREQFLWDVSGRTREEDISPLVRAFEAAIRADQREKDAGAVEDIAIIAAAAYDIDPLMWAVETIRKGGET